MGSTGLQKLNYPCTVFLQSFETDYMLLHKQQPTENKAFLICNAFHPHSLSLVSVIILLGSAFLSVACHISECTM